MCRGEDLAPKEERARGAIVISPAWYSITWSGCGPAPERQQSGGFSQVQHVTYGCAVQDAVRDLVLNLAPPQSTDPKIPEVTALSLVIAIR
jgi:hypothetical protein